MSLSRMYTIIAACIVVLGIAFFFVYKHFHPPINDYSLTLSSDDSNRTLNSGPIQIWDPHVTTNDPTGLYHVVGIVKNTGSTEITIGEIGIVNSDTVLFDEQKTIVLAPGQAGAFITDSQGTKQTDLSGDKLVVGVIQK